VDGGEVLAVATQQTERERGSRRRAWLALVVVVLVALLALAWATFVGWDTTAKITASDAPCGMNLQVGGMAFTVVPRHLGTSLEFPNASSAGPVLVHHRLFHADTYRVVAEDGSTVALRRGQGVACAGGP
jgi:hypothetical protein